VSSPVLRRPEFQDFCWDLGVSPAIHGQAADSVEMVAVRHMFAAPLPPEWSQHQDPRTGHSYFFDCLRGASSWKHPQDALFRDVLAEVQAWQSADTLEHVTHRSDLYLRLCRASAVRSLFRWSGPHALPWEEAEQGPPEDGAAVEALHFYHNEATGESRWLDPRMSAEFDLLRRHAVLSECIAAHSRALARRSAVFSARPLPTLLSHKVGTDDKKLCRPRAGPPVSQTTSPGEGPPAPTSGAVAAVAGPRARPASPVGIDDDDVRGSAVAEGGGDGGAEGGGEGPREGTGSRPRDCSPCGSFRSARSRCTSWPASSRAPSPTPSLSSGSDSDDESSPGSSGSSAAGDRAPPSFGGDGDCFDAAGADLTEGDFATAGATDTFVGEAEEPTEA